ncbi:MAG TPA: hypothetical protein VN661_00090 [Candidatus Acidoferrales bacterium]|nr:hypothetical protein [Candidatus Acidoferrales bacterium]
MTRKRSIRLVVAAVAVLMLLVFATTIGGIWHHHASSSEAACPICHLNHQPVQRPVATTRAPSLAVARSSLEASAPAEAPAPPIRAVPARAPPSA